MQSTMMTTLAHFREDDKHVHLEGSYVNLKSRSGVPAAGSKLETTQGSTSVIVFDALSQTMVQPVRLSLGPIKTSIAGNTNKRESLCLNQTGNIKKT